MIARSLYHTTACGTETRAASVSECSATQHKSLCSCEAAAITRNAPRAIWFCVERSNGVAEQNIFAPATETPIAMVVSATASTLAASLRCESDQQTGGQRRGAGVVLRRACGEARGDRLRRAWRRPFASIAGGEGRHVARSCGGGERTEGGRGQARGQKSSRQLCPVLFTHEVWIGITRKQI